MSTQALLDNSAFAGVMRLYCPELEMHRRFLHNYPEHRTVDELSLADFLTALCIYDELWLESSSWWNEKELQREGFEGDSSTIDHSSASWAEQLKRLLPQAVGDVIDNRHVDGPLNEDESCSKAFDIISSPLKESILLTSTEKIPNVYFAKDYIYRHTFDVLNEASGFRLNNRELAQAMFLHRGLFLQARAHENHCVYLPYYYRASMLSKLPPMVWVRAPDDGLVQARLPLSQGTRPQENDYIKALNEYYFSLLQAVTWTVYRTDVPFIGAAMLAMAKGDPRAAIDIALDQRDRGVLRKRFAELHNAALALDRPKFESLLKAYRDELAGAARHFGSALPSSQHKAFYELAISWAPKPLDSVVKAAVELLPESVRHWAFEASSKLVTKTPLQMLFVEHVHAIRGSAWSS